MSTIKHIRKTLLRDLGSLMAEIESYSNHDEIWTVPEGITNSAGTLTLHLCGNLQHFIGATLGSSGYGRRRDHEFSAHGLSAGELIAEIDRTITAVSNALEKLADDDLESEYPLKLGERTLPTELFLIHLCAHLAFHLGQIDYHRRLVTGRNRSITPQDLRQL